MNNKIKGVNMTIIILLTLFGCAKNEITKNKTTGSNQSPVIYYVSDAGGSDNNSGTTQSNAFKTISKAIPLARAGDIVYITTGVYNISSTINVVNSGTPDQYITIAAMQGNKPKIVVSGDIYNAVSINGSYIKLEGMEFQGNNANLNYTGAMNSYNLANSGGQLTGVYNTNAISIGGPANDSKLPHHVEIRNCIVHDFPAGGISAIQADYITIESNIVFNNAWYTIYASSGISILTPFDSDNNTNYKNIVTGNICYNNKTTIPWIQTKALSDGNGIIIDVNTSPYGKNSGPAYNGRTLVTNNICFNNGGSGIHSYSAGHVDIINNTAYFNGQVMGYPDIFANTSSDINIINNIMYSKNGGKVNDNFMNTNVVYDYNLYYNGSIAVMGPNDIVADPQFVKVSTNFNGSDFQLKSNSPAVNSGSSVKFANKDILGVARPHGSKPDRGAYESF